VRVRREVGVILKLDFEKAYDKVNWEFLNEALTQKKFPRRWIEWVTQAVERGKVSINVNEQGGYFRTYKGLRQGDPLSPLLFNLVVDALAAMLVSAKEKGRLGGLVPHLLKGVTYLQYADDTILMVQCNEEYILNLKFILYCFERMSGMKINYHKSEVYVIGSDLNLEEEIAAKLNRKLGRFPMVYLGIPIHTRKLRKQDLQCINSKMGKRTDPWQGRLMSSGGRLILVNSCLSSIPTYIMGFYHLTDGQHEELDSIRIRFFWQGGSKTFKYHMAK
jgi:hypothetical protein